MNPYGKKCAGCGKDIRPTSYLTSGRLYFCNINEAGLPAGCYERWAADHESYPDNSFDEFDGNDFYPFYDDLWRR